MGTLSRLGRTVGGGIRKGGRICLSTDRRVRTAPRVKGRRFFTSNLLSNVLRGRNFRIRQTITKRRATFLTQGGSSGPKPSVTFLTRCSTLPKLNRKYNRGVVNAADITTTVTLDGIVSRAKKRTMMFKAPTRRNKPGKDTGNDFIGRNLLRNVSTTLVIRPSGRAHLADSSLTISPLSFRFVNGPTRTTTSPRRKVGTLSTIVRLFGKVGTLHRRLGSSMQVRNVVARNKSTPGVVPRCTGTEFFVHTAAEADLGRMAQGIGTITRNTTLTAKTGLGIVTFRGRISGLLLGGACSRIFGRIVRSLKRAIIRKSESKVNSASTNGVDRIIPAVRPCVGVNTSSLITRAIPFHRTTTSMGKSRTLVAKTGKLTLATFRLMASRRLLGSVGRRFLRQGTTRWRRGLSSLQSDFFLF